MRFISLCVSDLQDPAFLAGILHSQCSLMSFMLRRGAKRPHPRSRERLLLQIGENAWGQIYFIFICTPYTLRGGINKVKGQAGELPIEE
jgi:hypothetical protein